MPISDRVESVTYGEGRVGRRAAHRNHSTGWAGCQHGLHRGGGPTRFTGVIGRDLVSASTHAKRRASHQTPFLA